MCFVRFFFGKCLVRRSLKVLLLSCIFFLVRCRLEFLGEWDRCVDFRWFLVLFFWLFFLYLWYYIASTLYYIFFYRYKNYILGDYEEKFFYCKWKRWRLVFFRNITSYFRKSFRIGCRFESVDYYWRLSGKKWLWK